MNDIEIMEDVISVSTKTVTNGMPVEQLDEFIIVNEVALGQCDKLINKELLGLEKHIGEMASIMDASPEDKKKLSSLVGSIENLDEILVNMRILTEARALLAARNAALT